jgi:hypothetical protein
MRPRFQDEPANNANPTRGNRRGLLKRTVFTLALLACVGTICGRASGATCNSTGSTAWGTVATWSCGHVPLSTDDVSILTGHAVTFNVASSTILSLTTSGTGSLSFTNNTNDSLTVTDSVTNGGSILGGDASGIRIHTLTVGGNLTNNGTFNGIVGDDRLNVVFNGSANQFVSGTGGTTAFNLITINNTGAANNNIVEVSSSNFSTAAAFLGNNTLTAGILKLSGSYTFTNSFFSVVGYTIAAGTGIWLNNPNVTVTGQNGSPTLAGLIRISNGTYNVGTASGNTLQYATGSSVTIDGGALNISGRFQGTGTTQTTTFSMTGGTMTVATIGNASNGSPGFDLSAAGSSFTMSGGTIVLQNRNTAATPVDYRNIAGTVNITGGTVQFGNASTAGSPTFVVGTAAGPTNTFPTLTVNATGTPSVQFATAATVRGNVNIGTGSTLNANGQALTVSGNSVASPGNWSNNGTFTSGTQTTTFNATRNQTIGGTSVTTFSTLGSSSAGAGGSNTVSLAQNAAVSVALNVTSGSFDQGASFNLSTGSGAVTISSGATLQNLGTGDLTVGPGGVANAGTINFNGNGASCGDADDILIRSSLPGTQRTWSGAGTFSFADVDVQDQRTPVVPPPVAIVVSSGTNSGNNTGWSFAGVCTAGTYVWTGAVSTDWQVAANWSPARTLPATGDVLLLDGNATPAPTITNVPTQTIAALRLMNAASATLNAATVAPPQTLTINGATGSDLSVPNLSLLKLAGASALQLSIASGSTGTVAGQILFQDGAHRLLGNAASGITFASTGRFTTSSGFTGNAFGTGAAGNGAAGSVIFQSGSIYFHNAGASPFGASPNPAVVTFQTGSEADFFTATGFEANGRTYANLNIGKGNPSGVAVNASDSGTGNFQFDNLVINNTDTVNSSLTFNGSGASTITIRGNITSVAAGSGGTLPDVTFTAGSGGILIDKPGGGTVTFGNILNSRTLEFESDTTIASGTTVALSRILLLGISQPNSLVMTVNGGLNGSASGYLIGNEKRAYTGAAAFTYHVGTVNGYSPLDANVTNVVGGTGNLTVAALQGAEPVLTSATSLQRYWNITEGGDLTSDLVLHYLDPTDIMGTEADYQVIVVEGGNATRFPPDANHSVDTAANTATITGVQNFSHWTLGAPNAPTAVKLASFTASERNGEVLLQWRTGYEARNLGYNLYREQDGQRVAITPSLVAGSALVAGRQTKLTAGSTYTWYDHGKQHSAVSNPQAPVTYWLEDVDLNGTRTLHGPIVVQAGDGQPQALTRRAELLDEVTEAVRAAGARAAVAGVEIKGGPAILRAAASSAEKLSVKLIPSAGKTGLSQREIAAMSAVKISVSRPGWYRLTRAELLDAGLDKNAIASQLQLYAQGAEVPIKVSGTLRASTDYIEFYGTGLDSPTETTQTYYLVAGKSAGQRIATRNDGVIGEPAGAASFDYTVERKERMVYFSGLLNGEAENFFGQIVSSSPATAAVPVARLDAAASGPAQLEVALQGVTSQSHLVQVRLNGLDLGTVSFANTDHPRQQFAVAAGALHEGDNSVELTSLGGDGDVNLVDTLRLTYARLFVADDNALAVTLDSAHSKRVFGFTNNQIRAVDVSNPNAVTQLNTIVATSGRGQYSATIQLPDASAQNPRTVLVFAGEATATAAGLKRNEPSAWATSPGYDYLIVTNSELAASVEPLAQLRRSQGLTVGVVNVEDVYDENSFGKHSPQALHDFLETAITTWQRKPRYVVLAGDSSYDPKNYFGQGFNDQVPTRLLDTAFLEAASDDWLADFNHDGIADLALGRLPARTAADLSGMVNKIIGYETAAPDPSRGALLVADTTFEAPSSAVGSLLPAGLSVQTINRGGQDDAVVHEQIIAGLNQGPRVANYFGHGSNGVWTGASLLSNDDAPSLTNTNRLSVFTMMTCFNGFFQDAYNESLSEALLKAPGGAVAVWASTTLTGPNGQTAIDKEFYRLLFGPQPFTLGDAARAAKLATGDADVRRTWTLFGDPAMKLR